VSTVIVRFARPTLSVHPSARALKHIEKTLQEQQIGFSGWVTDGGERGVLIVPDGFFKENKSIFDNLEDMTVEPERTSQK
jgi:hypothetical protein